MTLSQVVRTIAPRNRLQAVVLSAIVVGALTAGVSYASIPDGSGVIHGCYSKTGVLKVIDTAKVSSCPKGTTSLNWNQTGPAGPASSTSSMSTSPPIAPPPTSVTTASASCAAGKVLLSGGYSIFDPAGPADQAAIQVTANQPNPAGVAGTWTATIEATAGNAGAATITAYVVCSS